MVRVVVLLVVALVPALPVSAPSKAVLWEPPGYSRIHSLRFGPGGPEGVPRPPFLFLKEAKGGVSPKVWVSDARGRKWIVKWGKEVHSDTFSTRLAWAMGYFASPIYYVPSGRILGVKDAGQASAYIRKDGWFEDARFKLVDPSLEYVEKGWRWDHNPFMTTSAGRREISGLKILMMLLANWDGKDMRHSRGSNLALFRKTSGTRIDYYAMDDWGSTLGKWGHWCTRNEWKCESFTKQNTKLVKGLDEEGFVEWGYHGGAEKYLRDGILLSDVRWLLQYMGQLGDAEIYHGLRAAGAEETVSRCYARALRSRIQQLQTFVRTPSPLARR